MKISHFLFSFLHSLIEMRYNETMKHDPLNTKLITEFPKLGETYQSVKGGAFDLDTPSSAFYQEIFLPYVIESIKNKDEKEIRHCLDFIEDMMTSDNELENNVAMAFILVPLFEERHNLDWDKLPFGKESKAYLEMWVF